MVNLGCDILENAPRQTFADLLLWCRRKEALNTYFDAACAIGGHTPHILREALSWHINLEETGHMLKA